VLRTGQWRHIGRSLAPRQSPVANFPGET
jgi:hypothetical protein